jgi:DNA-binding IclR family transcriptional regulator
MSTTQTSNCNLPGPQPVPSVERAFDLLELLVYSGKGLTLMELSRRLGIPKSSMHYLVSTLVKRGYLVRDNDGHRFSLGYRMSEFAKAPSTQSQLPRTCRPYMVALVRKFDLTSLLAVLIGIEAVTIASVESSHDRGGGTWIGRHIEVHCTAQGKALIAYYSDHELEKLFGKRKFSIYTPKTIATLDALKVALREVRDKGYAVNDEEHTLGLRAVAAPIFDYTGTVVASLSLRVPTLRLPVWNIEHIGKEVSSVAHEISRHLSDPMREVNEL